MTDSSFERNAGRAWIKKVFDVWAFFRYNVANVFAGRALYFVILASAVFLAIVVLNLLNREATLTSQKIYDFLLIPGILLIFYPAVFAIQNDKDAGMIETLFGIPDYRYKIWLVRYFTLYVLAAGLLFVLAVFCRVGLADFPLGKMVLELMVPIVFLGSLAFFIASQTGSGLGTAVIMVLVVLSFWLFRTQLQDSPWYLFHNPFASTSQIKTMVLVKTTIANRLYFCSGSFFLTMLSLLRLQKREKFI